MNRDIEKFRNSALRAGRAKCAASMNAFCGNTRTVCCLYCYNLPDCIEKMPDALPRTHWPSCPRTEEFGKVSWGLCAEITNLTKLQLLRLVMEYSKSQDKK